MDVFWSENEEFSKIKTVQTLRLSNQSGRQIDPLGAKGQDKWPKYVQKTRACHLVSGYIHRAGLWEFWCTQLLRWQSDNKFLVRKQKNVRLSRDTTFSPRPTVLLLLSSQALFFPIPPSLAAQMKWRHILFHGFRQYDKHNNRQLQMLTGSKATRKLPLGSQNQQPRILLQMPFIYTSTVPHTGQNVTWRDDQVSSANKGTPDNRQPIQLIAIEYAHGGVMVSPYGNINWGGEPLTEHGPDTHSYTFPTCITLKKPTHKKTQPTLQWNLSQNKESSLKEKVLIKFENERKPSSKITYIGKIAINYANIK